MNENYKIVAINFSYHTEIENSSAMDFDNKVGVPHDEVSYVRAHIAFEYVVAGESVAGTCYTDIAKIGTVTYELVDGEIKATSYTPGDEIPDEDTVNSLCEAAVELEYQEIVIKDLQASLSRKYLADINASCAYDTQLSPAPVSYDELDEMTTHIGSNKVNILEL